MTEPPTGPVRTGGHRSVEILRELANTRISALGNMRASRAIGELNWQNAQAYAIQRDDFRSVWHAGHITAILSNDVDVVAATQTGGVWLLKSIPGPTALSGYTGMPLSDTWDAPDVSCLGWGTGAGQMYAGCTSGSAIILLEFDTVLGGLFLKQSTVLPVPFNSAASIVTLANPNRIVVATGEQGAVWWSPIPQPTAHASGYEWRACEGLPGFSTYRGLAAGPGASVAVVKEGGRSLGIGVPPAAAIYRGTFDGDVLVFTESAIEGVDPTLMRRTSLASCEDHRERMYAVSAAADGTILTVLSSLDGGSTWRARATPDKSKAGLNGFYNNCIAVSPQRADVVVIGWLSGGPFWSEDGAQSWLQPHNQETLPHLHNDLHAVYLGRNSGGPEPLYVGGDGGIVVTRDMGRTYHSQFNRPLSNLQFYGGARASILGTYGGPLTASSRYPGLLAGGTQDNGNVYRCPDRLRDPLQRPRQADMPWLKQMGGDGDLNRFVDPLGILLNFNNGEPRLGMALWDEAKSRFPEGRGTIIPADDATGGVAPSSVELVPVPAFRKNGHLMYAVVGSTSGGVIHGLFAADPAENRPDAREVMLIRLGAVGGIITAIGTMDGSSLMIGTDNARIVSFDSASGATTDYALPDIADGVVARIEVFTTPVLAGSLPDNAFALVGGRILRFNGLFWATTTGTDWTTFAFDAQSSRLFAASDGDVFASTDWGLSWSDASEGLPARPHCADLRIAADGKGGRDLYLATYGRSVWRATIAKRSEIFDLPPEATELLIGVLEDGGGLVRLGKKIIKIPPRPLTRDIFAALAAADLAQSMSKESEINSRAILRTSLQQIASMVLREVDRLG